MSAKSKNTLLGILVAVLPFVVGAAGGISAWSFAEGRTAQRIDHIEASAAKDRQSIEAIRLDVARIREDVAYIRGKLEGR